MPQQHPTTTGTGLTPVPVSFFLHSAVHRRPNTAASPSQTDWCGLSANQVAHLIRALTRHRDVLVDLDHDPLITDAARYLGRQPAHLTDGNLRRLEPALPVPRIAGDRDGAG